MRISTDKHDPGYDEAAASRALKVVLDNRPVTGCITADSDRGEIVTYTPLTWKPWAAILSVENVDPGRRDMPVRTSGKDTRS